MYRLSPMAVVWRGDASYEALRKSMLWNALKPARFPEAIVRATSEEDVVAAVALARARGLQVAVRAGGHSWVGSPLRDGSLLIDLSALRGLTVDAATRTASVQPAATAGEFAAALQPHGLAFPVGHCPSVGISGYLLSGGLGWNGGAWGPACLSLRAIDVVTADGRLVHADEHENAELLWAARGAGPAFPAVVTRFVVDLQPLPRAITSSICVYDLSDLERVAGWAAETVAALPPTVELTLLLAAAPGVGRALIVSAVAFEDSEESARAALAPFERSPDRALVRRAFEPSTFQTLFRDFGSFWPEGHRFASDNAWANADFGDLLLPLRDRMLAAPSPKSLAFAAMSAPAGDDEPPLPDMAFSMVGQSFAACYAVWESEADDAANLRWLPSTMAALEPLAIGHYIAEADPSRARRSFAQPNWDRLHQLRRSLDPDGRFPSYLA
jgi:FAD/FMN-containing dehydrogenase